MPALFVENRGVAAAHLIGGLPAFVTLDGWGAGPGFKCVVTGFRLGGQGGYQFLHTLREVIYVYVFGERIGQLGITGVAFMGSCSGGGTGLDNFFKYYNERRLSRTGGPVRISLGTVPIQGLITSFDFQLVDAQYGLGQFSLQMAYPPQG